MNERFKQLGDAVHSVTVDRVPALGLAALGEEVEVLVRSSRLKTGRRDLVRLDAIGEMLARRLEKVDLSALDQTAQALAVATTGAMIFDSSITVTADKVAALGDIVELARCVIDAAVMLREG